MRSPQRAIFGRQAEMTAMPVIVQILAVVQSDACSLEPIVHFSRKCRQRHLVPSGLVETRRRTPKTVPTTLCHWRQQRRTPTIPQQAHLQYECMQVCDRGMLWQQFETVTLSRPNNSTPDSALGGFRPRRVLGPHCLRSAHVSRVHVLYARTCAHAMMHFDRSRFHCSNSSPLCTAAYVNVWLVCSDDYTHTHVVKMHAITTVHPTDAHTFDRIHTCAPR